MSGETRRLVRVDEDALSACSEELARAAEDARDAEARLAAELSKLAADPGGYAAARETLDALDADRRQALARVGELALRFLATREVEVEVEREIEIEPPAAAERLPAPESLSYPEAEAAPCADAAPVEPNEPPASVEPVSSEQLARFFEATASRAPVSGRGAGGADVDRAALLGLAAHVRLARDAPDEDVARDELAQLTRACAPERREGWRRMSDDAQVRWVGTLVAWARALHADARRLGLSTGPAGDAHRALYEYTTTRRPGFVHGFKRDAAPASGDWRSDAVGLLDEILARPDRSPPPPVSSKKAERPSEPELDTDAPLPTDWPHVDRLRGRRAVMFGGEVREERRVALERAFQLASLEWIPHDRPRLLTSLKSRAARASIDFVLVNKFVAHKESASLERSSVVPVLIVRHGYGVTAVRQAFEDHFARGEAQRP